MVHSCNAEPAYGVRVNGQAIPVARFEGPDAKQLAVEYARRLNYGAMGDSRYDETWDQSERLT